MAKLVLESGVVFSGTGFGAFSPGEPPRTIDGEVVFNTAMCGYQEALTDPSYAGQILVMTPTQVGNYGVNEEDIESARPQVAAFVVRELSRSVSNHRATQALSDWLADWGVPAITGIDTRALVRRIRTAGAMRGVMSSDPALTGAALVERARRAEAMSGRNLASTVAPQAAYTSSLGGLGDWWPERENDVIAAAPEGPKASPRVVAIDCGAKRAILRHLEDRGCEVHCVPDTATAEEIRALEPDGLFVSNGPGDPAAVEHLVATLRDLAGTVPTFGICLGHQLLALALGATTYKLPFGHRGANQPVRDLRTERVEITSQNHGFCVDEASLAAAGCTVTHRHLNDDTVAGFRHETLPIFAVQYHPEASPGPHDSGGLFDEFVASMSG